MEVLVCENRCFPFTELLSQIELTLISLIFQRERMTFRNVNYRRLLLMRADIRVNIRAGIRVILIKKVTY